MHASHRWLNELSGLALSPDEMARKLTSVGLEVDAVVRRGEGLDSIVLAEVRGKNPHPTKSGLTLVDVFDGTELRVIVCGAPNVPEPGGRVVLAKLGAKLPNGLEIAPRKVAGVDSPGMLCGETELDLGPDDSGLFLVPDEIAAPLGTPIADALSLRDAIIEIGLTPNRPDCLGHIGLARELCAIEGKSFTAPSSSGTIAGFVAARSEKSRIDVAIEDAARCPRYGASRVSGTRVGASPFWLRYRLHTLGIRPISNVVDATNLVMLEWGHPIHAFDVARLRGGAARIVVRPAAADEKMLTLDGVERTFGPDDLLICDAAGPVALAGVMGGELSGIEPATSEVLIECAYFDPRSVRRTARRQGMHTDASHRFERGVDPNAVRPVLERATALIAELTGGTAAAEAVDAYPAFVAPRTVTLRDARMTSLLGIEIPRDRARRILEGLGVRVLSADASRLECEIPTHRPDLGREVDLIEEVARLFGYDRLPTALARVRPSVDGTRREIPFARSLKLASAATGMHEAVCYGFVAPEDLEKHRVPTRAVVLANPLSVERSVMRTSLLPGLAAAASRALRHGAREVRLFELGSSFHPRDGEQLPDERATLAFMLLGEHEEWFGSPRSLDFYDAKGHVEAVLRSVSGHLPEVFVDDSLDARAPYLHPRRRASVRLGGVVVGHLGEIHPDVVDAIDLGGRGLYVELDVARLLESATSVGVKMASGLPRFPAVTRDLALLVDETHPVDALRRSISEVGEALVERVELFDEYRGEHVPSGKRSLGFRITYRDAEATLTDARVDVVHGRIVDAMSRTYGAERR